MSASLDEALPALRVRALPGVWPPQRDARLLAKVMIQNQWARGASVLDMFTGSGVLAITAAKEGAGEVMAVDLSRKALLTVKINAAVHSARVKTARSDMFSALGDRSFDLVLANPPYIPGPAEVPSRGIARAWEGGYDGRLLIDRLCQEAPAHLRPGGHLLIVHSSMNGEQLTLERLEQAGLSAAVRLRHQGRLGRVSAGREEILRARGLLTGDIEETLVISAQKPAA